MPRKEWNSEEADIAAEAASDDLETIERKYPDALRELADWWKSYYLTTGHKRLGRLLLQRNTRLE